MNNWDTGAQAGGLDVSQKHCELEGLKAGILMEHRRHAVLDRWNLSLLLFTSRFWSKASVGAQLPLDIERLCMSSSFPMPASACLQQVLEEHSALPAAAPQPDASLPLVPVLHLVILHMLLVT
jgi:hypothetical protein